MPSVLSAAFDLGLNRLQLALFMGWKARTY